jgi:hypothetical protein
MRRGRTCGSTTRKAICHEEPPSVSALTICSRGSSIAFSARSRIIVGATPMAIRVIFEVSPSPMTMNRTGSSASGGTIEMTATKGASSALR